MRISDWSSDVCSSDLEGQVVIAMLVAGDETQSVLTATENGFGKRTSIVEYTRHGRGTKGMIAIQTSARNGKVVGAVLDRKSVGEGKSVSVRVDLGGRRNYKKKKK